MLVELFRSDSKVAELSASLMKKLNADQISDLIAIANENGLEGRKADSALENALLKHANAMIKAAPKVTADNVSVNSLMSALSSELSKNTKGEHRGL